MDEEQEDRLLRSSSVDGDISSEDSFELSWSKPENFRVSKSQIIILIGLLTVSFGVNILLASMTVDHAKSQASTFGNAFRLVSRTLLIGYNLTAKLEESEATYFTEDEFVNDNQTIADAAWLGIEIVTGFIALNQQTTEEYNLPQGDVFPWDGNKSVYVLNMYHSLHCLVWILTLTRIYPKLM